MLDELLEIETRGWLALSSVAERAKAFYAAVLTRDAVMLLPGGMILEGKERILDSFDAQAWSTFAIEEPRVVPLGEDAAVLAYRVMAQREGAGVYAALISSVYDRRDGRWLLAFHQHTPFQRGPGG